MFQGEVKIPKTECSIKKQRFLPDIPSWELEIGFDTLSLQKRDSVNFINYRGVISQPLNPPCAESVIYDNVDVDLDNLRFRDPNSFLAGNLHNYYQEWLKLSPSEEVFQTF